MPHPRMRLRSAPPVRAIGFLTLALASAGVPCPAQAPPVPEGSRLVLTGTVVEGEAATGSVVDPQGRTLSGVVVEVAGEQTTTDAYGRFVIPAGGSRGESVAVRLPKEIGEETGAVAVVAAAAEPAYRPDVSRLPRYAIVSDFMTIQGQGFAGDAAGNTVHFGGTEAQVLASSSVEVVVAPTPATALGEQQVTITTATGTSEPASTQVVRLSLVSEDTQLTRGQSGSAFVELSGTPDEVLIDVTNEDPSVIELVGGAKTIVMTDGGTENRARLRYRAVGPGAFRISVEIVDDETPDPGPSEIVLLQVDTLTDRRYCQPATTESAQPTIPGSADRTSEQAADGRADVAPDDGAVLCSDLDDCLNELNAMRHASPQQIRERAERAKEKKEQVRTGHLELDTLESNVGLASTIEKLVELLKGVSAAARGACPDLAALETEVAAAVEETAKLLGKLAAAHARKRALGFPGLEPHEVEAVTMRSTYWDNFMLSPAFRKGFKECQGQMVIAPAPGRARLSAEVYIDVLRDEILKGNSWSDAVAKAIEAQVEATEKAVGNLGNSKDIIRDGLLKFSECQRKKYYRSLGKWLAEIPVFSNLNSGQRNVVMRIFFAGATEAELRTIAARRQQLAAIDREIVEIETKRSAIVNGLSSKLVEALSRCVLDGAAEVRRLFLYVSLLEEYAKYSADHDHFGERMRIRNEPSSNETFCERLKSVMLSPPLPGASEAERKFLRCVFISLCGEAH